ncbi:MAG: hypothetical protein AB1593_01980 [Pseudomonadota bacterium]
MTLLAVAFFLPLFPLSIVLNGAFVPLRSPRARAVLLVLWPQCGVILLQMLPHPVPHAFVPWALLTSGFYALRLLTVRDMGMWAGFLATSALALTWVLAAGSADPQALHLFTLWFSLPAALLALLAQPLTKRFGAAYAGLQDGLIGSLPRLSVVLAVTVLAAIATPPFPGFFALLHLLRMLEPGGAIGVLLIWLTWGWAATRLLQGFVFGRGRGTTAGDIGHAPMLSWSGALGVFVVAGFMLTGGGL